jgi:hypothetical protein
MSLEPYKPIQNKPYGEHASPEKVMPLPTTQPLFCTKADGYRGFWHAQPPFDEAYGYKYSGGLGTYSCKHHPQAIYAPAVNKTFFCWGGTARGYSGHTGNWDFCQDALYHMVSWYDHETGLVPKPTLLFDKYCADAHDNPVISLDDAGHIWIFSPSHGDWTTRSFIHRSTEPYQVDRFETVSISLFAYPQVHHVPGWGFAFFHTLYGTGRGLRFTSSRDGFSWSDSRTLAYFGQGHYQVTQARGPLFGSMFDYHPEQGGLDKRTNLYYIQSIDGGESWTTVDGQPLQLPLEDSQNPALVHNHEKEGRLVYLKDLQFDEQGHPVLLYLTSGSPVCGPAGDPRTWHLTRWDGVQWLTSEVTRSRNNYDHGFLHLERDDCWTLVAPMEDGPQPWNPGGEVAVWRSTDKGATWARHGQLTEDSRFNHTFVRRPVQSHPGFHAFWADGDTWACSPSRLYFATKEGDVYCLPERMEAAFEKPEKVVCQGCV